MRYLLFSSFYIFNLMAQAHPVTYEDGYMIQSLFRQGMSKNSLLYTFHNKWAGGVEVTRFDDGIKSPTWALVDLNFLVKKWNMDGAQANIYLISGVGAVIQDEESELGAKAGIEVDYETRQFYTLAQYRKYWSAGRKKSDVDEEINWYQYRVGFAPYVVGYEGMHTWAILQLDYRSEMDKNIMVTPLLRFFYKNILWEIGGSTRGNMFFQFMVHM